jgi:hypothetical protein
MNVIILILLALAIIFSVFSFYTRCPKCKECGDSIQREQAAPLLDLQFSPKNFPSLIYDNLFNQPPIYHGGYILQGSGKNNNLNVGRKEGTSKAINNGIDV